MLNLLKTETAAKLSQGANGHLATDTSAQSNSGLVYVPLARILDNPYQPRTQYEPEHILNLALSIKHMKEELPTTKGLQQVPVARVFHQQPRDGEMVMAGREMYINGTVTRLLDKPNGLVQLMFGHSRLRAFMVLAEGLRSLGTGSAIGMDFAAVAELETRFAELLDADIDYTKMPLTLGFALDHAMWAHAITENSQRKNITAVEEAVSIQRAIDEFGLKVEEAGKPFGYARSTTANKLRLLQLPAEVRVAIADGRLTERHGRELMRLIDAPTELGHAVDQALKKGWSVRQLASDVDWRERQMKAEQKKAAEYTAARQALTAGWSLPGQTALVPVDKLVASSWVHCAFDATDPTHAALVEQGACGPHCECFVLSYSAYRNDGGFYPDQENAPHILAMCADRTGLQNKRLHVAPDADPAAIAKRQEQEERDRKAEAMNNEAHTIWQRWLADQDLQALWNDIRFWKEATKETYWLQRTIEQCDDTHDGCKEVLRLLYRGARHWDDEIGREVHKPEEIQALIVALGGSVSRETEGGEG